MTAVPCSNMPHKHLNSTGRTVPPSEPPGGEPHELGGSVKKKKCKRNKCIFLMICQYLSIKWKLLPLQAEKYSY